ncbi:hypothetical protein [Psychrosphaera algicola]|uniref:TonB-dependent receptor n=1 Tax=Psychrosphaera algicola TaxID=3023714 RepID=A0ABT5FAD3_9GAMM|nr:hypothetical protein [Psychrosphaera sp. G1-22]MDC2887587.1 hypothetical protein [Psychrosphaera sp. G1-22]
MSHQTSFYQLYNSDGSQLPLDITNGINPKFDILSLEISKDLQNDWRFVSSIRSTTGSNGFYSLFNDPPAETSRLTNDQFNRIQGFTGVLGDAYSDAVGVKAYYSDTVTGTDLTGAEEAPSILAHNIPVYGKVDATSNIADFKLSKEFEVGDNSHELTFGYYTSHYTYDVYSVFASGWSDIGESARLVDLYAVDNNEQQVGPSITRGGLDQPAIFGLGADATMRTNAFYALDHMTLLDGDLLIDLGVRWQELDVDRLTTNSFDPE